MSTAEREEPSRLRHQVRQRQQERDILAKATPVLRSQRCDFNEVFGPVMPNQVDFPMRTMHRVLGLSASGFYASRERAPSQRSITAAAMTQRIRQIHKDSDESLRLRRVWVELIERITFAHKAQACMAVLTRIEGCYPPGVATAAWATFHP